MNDATSISDLQIAPIGNNITMTATEQYNPNPTPTQPPEPIQGDLDESTVHLLINGLQKASMSGATKIPTRDISMTPSHYTNDAQIQQNYIPPPKKNDYDYIQETEKLEFINNHKPVKKRELIDDIYNEIQIPLLLGVLFFLFQLPFFKKWLFRYLPYLFLKDGNLNIYGFGFSSFLFGFIYYSVNKLSIQLNTI
jgi:hypothetical protein